jgi:hypothetical protein
MKNYAVTTWAWDNILCGEKAPRNLFVSCFFNHNYAVDADNKIYDTIVGDVIRETEKAICIETTINKFNSRCDITGSYKWTYWIPKSQLVKDAVYFPTYELAQGWAKRENLRVCL